MPPNLPGETRHLERLSRIEYQLQRMGADMDAEKASRVLVDRELMDKLAHVEDLLTGNGTRTSLFLRLDRLERGARVVGRVLAWLSVILSAVVIDIIQRALR